MIHIRKFARALLCLCALGAAPAMAQVVVPAASSFNLNGGSLALGGSNLQVAGAFNVGAGSIQNAANISIAGGGNINGGSGVITLFGDWSNLGSFLAGSSQVNFVDGGRAQSNLSGNTTFANLSFVSSTGKIYSLAVGSTQSISGLLQILGTASAGIQIQSSTNGQVAFVNLLAGGSQNIDFVGVSNVHAIGQPLAPTKTNDGGRGDSIGWFGQAAAAATVEPTPSLSDAALWLLILTMIGCAGISMRRHSRMITLETER